MDITYNNVIISVTNCIPLEFGLVVTVNLLNFCVYIMSLTTSLLLLHNAVCYGNYDIVVCNVH